MEVKYQETPTRPEIVRISPQRGQIKAMEVKYQETPTRPEIVRIPPQRGQIKPRIFKGFAQKVKNATSLIGFAKMPGGNGSSASTSTYTSEGHSDS